MGQHGSGVIAEREIATLDDASLKWTLVHGHEITEEASCSQTADGMHYLEPTMMMMIEEALAVLGEGSAVSSIRADNTDDGHHPLKKMQKRVLAHEKKMKREKAQHKMRKVEEVRKKNAGKQGEGDHKKKMKNARTRKDEATQTHDAEQEETRNYKHALDDRRRSDEALANETVDDN